MPSAGTASRRRLCLFRRPDAVRGTGQSRHGRLAANLPIPAAAVDDLAAAVNQHEIDVTIIGPKPPLAAGLADRLRDAGRAVFGPSAALHVSSRPRRTPKRSCDAPCPHGGERHIRRRDADIDYIGSHPEPLVVKASGLAAGKGAVVCKTRADAAAVARAISQDPSAMPAERS